MIGCHFLIPNLSITVVHQKNKSSKLSLGLVRFVNCVLIFMVHPSLSGTLDRDCVSPLHSPAANRVTPND